MLQVQQQLHFFSLRTIDSSEAIRWVMHSDIVVVFLRPALLLEGLPLMGTMTRHDSLVFVYYYWRVTGTQEFISPWVDTHAIIIFLVYIPTIKQSDMDYENRSMKDFDTDINCKDFYTNLQDEIEIDLARMKKSIEVVKKLRSEFKEINYMHSDK